MRCSELTPLKVSIKHSGEMEITQWGKAAIAENKTKMLKPNVTTGVHFWNIVNYFNIWKHSID